MAAAAIALALASSFCKSYGESAEDGENRDAPIDASSADASSETGGRCTSEGTAMPTSVFNATPEPANINGPACDVDNALVRDGLVAGLDRDDAPVGKIADREVNGCVGARFDPTVALDAVFVTAKPMANACAASACADPECGTGRGMLLFAGAEVDQLTFIGEEALTTAELSTYRIALPQGIVGRVVVVCRAPYATQRDDVGVDAIVGNCR